MIAVRLSAEREKRLRRLAKVNGEKPADLAGKVLTVFLECERAPDTAWVSTTQGRLARVWTPEDFSTWNPPRES